jgi:hypothetical protein
MNAQAARNNKISVMMMTDFRFVFASLEFGSEFFRFDEYITQVDKHKNRYN